MKVEMKWLTSMAQSAQACHLNSCVGTLAWTSEACWAQDPSQSAVTEYRVAGLPAGLRLGLSSPAFLEEGQILFLC